MTAALPKSLTAADVRPLLALAALRVKHRAATPADTEAAAHLRTFLDGAWPVLEPGKPLTPGWHLDAICEYLEAVSLGQIKRLVINVPPRSGKSTVVTICWPAWSWIARPESRWLFGSYSLSLSLMHSLARRTLLQSPWYTARWGRHTLLAADDNQKSEFSNARRGKMTAASMGGGAALGRGGDCIVIDDPHDPQGAESDTERATTIRNFDLTFTTRLDDPATGAIVIVMQRLHEQDLAAHCLAQGYTHLCLPMRAEDRERIVFPVSKREITREPGELLNTERWPAPVIADLESALGSYGAAGQLQQSPAPQEGGILKVWWWRFWYPADGPAPPVERVKRLDGTWHECPQAPLPARFDLQQQSWDLAFKGLDTSDYVAGEVEAQLGANIYILDEVYKHLDITETLAAIEAFSARWPDALGKLIEDKANGPAVVTMLHNKLPGLLAVDPRGGKVARAQAAAPLCEAGNVYLPHPALFPWVRRFIRNAALFPNAAHDDDVDRFTQGVIRLAARRRMKVA